MNPAIILIGFAFVFLFLRSRQQQEEFRAPPAGPPMPAPPDPKQSQTKPGFDQICGKIVTAGTAVAAASQGGPAAGYKAGQAVDSSGIANTFCKYHPVKLIEKYHPVVKLAECWGSALLMLDNKACGSGGSRTRMADASKGEVGIPVAAIRADNGGATQATSNPASQRNIYARAPSTTPANGSKPKSGPLLTKLGK